MDLNSLLSTLIPASILIGLPVLTYYLLNDDLKMKVKAFAWMLSNKINEWINGPAAVKQYEPKYYSFNNDDIDFGGPKNDFDFR